MKEPAQPVASSSPFQVQPLFSQQPTESVSIGAFLFLTSTIRTVGIHLPKLLNYRIHSGREARRCLLKEERDLRSHQPEQLLRWNYFPVIPYTILTKGERLAPLYVRTKIENETEQGRKRVESRPAFPQLSSLITSARDHRSSKTNLEVGTTFYRGNLVHPKITQLWLWSKRRGSSLNL